MTLTSKFLIAGAFGLAALHASALTVSGTTSGSWASASPTGGTIVDSGLGTSTFNWGTAASGSTQNSLTFTGSSFSGQTGTAFKVGNLSYLNGSTNAGTSPDSAQMALNMIFQIPGSSNTTTNFQLSLLTTPNTGTDAQNADIVTLSQPTSSSFTLNGNTYNIQVTGFGNIAGGGSLSADGLQLSALEGQTASADVFATVNLAAAVPEPSSYALMLGGLGLIGFTARRRSQARSQR